MRGQPNPTQALLGEARGGDTNSPARAGKPRSSLGINYPVIVGFRALSSPAAGACWMEPGEGSLAPTCSCPAQPRKPYKESLLQNTTKAEYFNLAQNITYLQPEGTSASRTALPPPQGADSDKRHRARVPRPLPAAHILPFKRDKTDPRADILFFSPKRDVLGWPPQQTPAMEVTLSLARLCQNQ